MSFQSQTSQSAWDRRCDLIDEAMKTGRFASRHDAGKQVDRQHPEVAKARPDGTSGAAGSGAQYASAEAELDSRAKRIMAEERCSYAQAYVKALNADRTLYVRYLEEHLRELERQDGGRRG